MTQGGGGGWWCCLQYVRKNALVDVECECGIVLVVDIELILEVIATHEWNMARDGMRSYALMFFLPLLSFAC